MSTSAYGSWVSDTDLAAGSVFGGYADEYDIHRPSYPKEMWDKVFDCVRKEAGTNAHHPLVGVDVAAGTGRGALEMFRRGLDVTAVDFDADMLAALESRADDACSNSTTDDDTSVHRLDRRLLRTHVSRAEDLSGLHLPSLPTSSPVSLLTALQSFHWFQTEAALAQFHNLLLQAPPGLNTDVSDETQTRSETGTGTGAEGSSAGGGSSSGQGLFLVAWNDRDLRIPWMAEYEDILERHIEGYDRGLKQAETVIDGGRLLTQSGLFEEACAPLVIPNPTPGYNSARLAALNQTFSYVRNALEDRTDGADSTGNPSAAAAAAAAGQGAAGGASSSMKALEKEMEELVVDTFGSPTAEWEFPWVCKAWVMRPVVKQ
jgi:SAM-dependent methyltransferase